MLLQTFISMLKQAAGELAASIADFRLEAETNSKIACEGKRALSYRCRSSWGHQKGGGASKPMVYHFPKLSLHTNMHYCSGEWSAYNDRAYEGSLGNI